MSHYTVYHSHGYGSHTGALVGIVTSLWGIVYGVLDPGAVLPWVVAIGGATMAGVNYWNIVRNRIEAGNAERRLIVARAQVDEARIRAGLPPLESHEASHLGFKQGSNDVVPSVGSTSAGSDSLGVVPPGPAQPNRERKNPHPTRKPKRPSSEDRTRHHADQ